MSSRSSLLLALATPLLAAVLLGAAGHAAPAKPLRKDLPTPGQPGATPVETFAGTCGLVATTVSDPEWVMATSDFILSSGRCVASEPCDPRAWYDKVFAPCYGQNRYWKLAPNSGSAFVYPMSALGVGTFDGMYIRRGVKFRLYSGTGTGTPFGPAMTGPQYVSITYWRDVNVACDGFEPGTFFVSGGPGALSNYSIRIGGDVTVVGDVDLLKKDNRKDHHTERFTDDFVLRRATTFKLKVKLSEAYGSNCHEVYLKAEHTFDGAATTIDIPASETPVSPTAWGVERVGVTTNADKTRTVELKVTIPPDASVGRYTMKLYVREKGETNPVAEKAFTDPVVLLFNPYDADDAAYLASAGDRKEYVEGETGTIWTGGRTSMGSLSWNYAPFDKTVLKVSLNLLNGLSSAQRKDPIFVSRKLSAVVNSNGGGVLEGRWGTDYSGGRKPWLWAGSDEILKQYDSGGGPVRYGQCWVFAGTLTTTLRTLGIAARPVTNFDSAHDTDVPPNRSVDHYWHADGTPNTVRNRDSIWNFHVWVDAWMKRSDGGGDGWQAVDATPQELSGGEYQMGPASHTSIKANAGGNYDVGFVTAEVDADEKYWREQPAPAPDLLLGTKDKHVGFFISTKAVGGGGRDDVTALYKTPETYTPMPNFLRGYDQPAVQDEGSVAGVIVGFTAPETVPLGQPIVWTISLENTSGASRTVRVILGASAIGYDGSIADSLAGLDQSVTLAPAQVTSVSRTIPESQYAAYTGSLRTFQAMVSATVSGDPGAFLSVQRTVLTGADVSVSATPSLGVPVGGTTTVNLAWTNPLSAPLTNAVAVLTVDGGLGIDGSSQTQIALGTVGAGAPVALARTVDVLAPGTHRVNADILGDQLSDVGGFAEVRSFADCNHNALDDSTEIANGTLPDCNGNGIPDGCEPDCNGNGVPDDCDIANATAPDCNANGVPDGCDIASGMPDVNANGVPDTCEVDCNRNGVPDGIDLANGTSHDTNQNGVPDECDLDCNGNGFADELDIAERRSADANLNGVPDECEGLPPLPVGTCCLPSGTCGLTTQGNCAAQYGYYQGDSTTCVTEPCVLIAASDQCAGANLLLRCTSGVLVGDMTGATADYDPGVNGCASGFDEIGRDVVYAMNLSAGDEVNLVYRQNFYDAALYIVTDCTNPAGTCLAGADNTYIGSAEPLLWTAPASGTYYLILDSYGAGTGSTWRLDYSIACAVGVEDDAALAARTRIDDARPNPFRFDTQLSFSISTEASRSPVSLEVFDLAGHRVARLHHGPLAPGAHVRRWDGRSESGGRVAAGVYFVKLSTSEGVSTTRVTRLR